MLVANMLILGSPVEDIERKEGTGVIFKPRLWSESSDGEL